MYKISNNNLKNKVENGLEKNDAENILTQNKLEKGYTKRQKISLFLGAFLFIVIGIYARYRLALLTLQYQMLSLAMMWKKLLLESGILDKRRVNKIKSRWDNL